MTPRTALLFPTFPMRDPEFDLERIEGVSGQLSELAEQAGAVVELDPSAFDRSPEALVGIGLEGALQAHYGCFIENVACAQWLESRDGEASMAAGYSMGMFPALAHLGAVSFEDGLRVMRDICTCIHRGVGGTDYATGAVIGLDQAVLAELLLPQVEVTDVYSLETLLVAGPGPSVAAVLEGCEKAGAYETKLIPVSAPFHSTALQFLEDQFFQIVDGIEVRAPRIPIVSAGTQQQLTTPAEIREELGRNASRPMRWFATIQTLVDAGAERFFECGASPRLRRMTQREFPELAAVGV